MATITVAGQRQRTIQIALNKAEMEGVLMAGLQALFSAELPADFALDADDTLLITPEGGNPIYNRANNFVYNWAINETDDL